MLKSKHFKYIILFIAALLIVSQQTNSFAAEALSIMAQVDKQEVAVGESLLLQVKIDGDDSPAEPDLSGITDFTVQPMGGGQSNRESVTIINGKVNRIAEHGYVFRYALTPKKDGTLTIPALTVNAAGKTLMTQPLTIKVEKPQQTDEFKLVQKLSETDCYVGQPLVYTVVWFVDRNIDEFQFILPVLEDQRFEGVDFPEDRDYKGRDAIAINLQGKRVIARKGEVGQYTTVTLRRIFIPREPGTYSIKRASVSSRVVTGYRQQQGGQLGNPFNDRLFDDFFGRRQPVYKQLLTTANSLDLKVKPLPEENRPQNFTGFVGEYSIAAEADPVEVNVGDPITLNIMVTGSEYMDNVVLPPLDEQPGMDKFKVPEEMGQGEINDRVKTFTQTIRAQDPAVTEIPAISLPYFNPKTDRYETARSNAIPLQVHATRVITALDAEGKPSGARKNELTTQEKGISQNYVGEDVLVNQNFEIDTRLSSPKGLIFLFFPPAGYLLVLVPTFIRRRRQVGKEALQARKALHVFSRELADLEKNIGKNGLQVTVGGLVEAMRGYLGRRLQMPAGSIIFIDVSERLERLGVDRTLLAQMQEIVDWCEAYHYGGIDGNGSGQAGFRQMLHNTRILFEKIDRCFKK